MQTLRASYACVLVVPFERWNGIEFSNARLVGSDVAFCNGGKGGERRRADTTVTRPQLVDLMCSTDVTSRIARHRHDTAAFLMFVEACVAERETLSSTVSGADDPARTSQQDQESDRKGKA